MAAATGVSTLNGFGLSVTVSLSVCVQERVVSDYACRYLQDLLNSTPFVSATFCF